MGKVANALKMLILLKSRGKMKISELADILEVNERSIRIYKDELEKASIYIDSISGKYGGYKLSTEEFIPSLQLDEKEYEALIMAKKLLDNDNFILSKEYAMAVDKINVSRKNDIECNIINNNCIIKTNMLNYDLENEKEIWLHMNSSIIYKNKVKMNYCSSENKYKERIVHPYNIFQYKGSIYLRAYCEYRKDIRYFKLSRIKGYVILKDRFEINKNFESTIDPNCLGIFQGEEMNVKMEIKYPIAQTVKERVWGKNQIILENKANNSIIFEAKVKDTEETKTWILGMGSSAVILKPVELIEKIKLDLEKSLEIYK
ncbi:WYL domain-containing protein [Clostridium botulinum]|uniref:Transcriptional regulator n=1 Tax=Clostridium botulinum C/D str. DC5 TaxID=1443128 RepID=A0A0A0II10_CLOBO|nr:WYL domain-containing protein [Clostridium botulinum]KEI06839.1 hypothetical protein Z952_02805 [Clostridium botulinum C/D str. BKT75002]KEI11594.1 hypothetical protein Z954_07440 [Clostridium botulinum C/D str. BKT2873]KGM99200.1 hypothetical protein Z955_08765 [Clostridium botulinum C/D str. DC5]KOC51043.1 hypothetical protein ADU89_14130 [Clostridium botulinum]KOC53220.1 hypothetical protein ADU90_13970 [Clostridium botulinum]